MLRKLWITLLFFPLFCGATDLKPWFDNQYEVIIRAKVLYQNYPSNNDEFYTLSAMYPFKRFCGEFEATAAHTRYQNHRWDNFRLTGRYQWLDDANGDLFSLVTGFILTQPFSRALHDVSSFHHGHIEGEMNLAFGKKYPYSLCENYRFRWWNVAGIATADNSSPWIREDAACEYNFNDVHYFRVFANTLWGLGSKRLHLHDFHGYGEINHQSVDLGLRYGFNMGCWGTLILQYARRVYAKNFPRDANLFLFELYYPFGEQVPNEY